MNKFVVVFILLLISVSINGCGEVTDDFFNSGSTQNKSDGESTSRSSSSEQDPLAGREIVGALSTNLEVN